jgi:ADP-L-glycero-D-manno-heptose 6-epimerase
VKILLTGHKGFIGSHFLSALKDQDVSTFEWGEKWPDVAGLDWVIHCGAISSTVEQDVKKILRQNYEFSIWLFESCKHHRVNLQYSSSASVYGLVSTFREDAPVSPQTPYAHSKALFDDYCSKYTYGNIVQGFRYFNVYGPEGEEHKGDQASPFAKFKKQAETGKIQLFAGSEHFERDFIHVSEVVSKQLKFLDIPESGIFNIGTGRTRSFKNVAESFNVAIEEIPMPSILKDNYQAYTCADMTKTDAILSKYSN